MGWILLLAPAAAGLALAAAADPADPERHRRALRAFAWGMAAFPVALAVQLILLGGYGPAALPLPLGLLAVFAVVGPSEEILKAAAATRLRPGLSRTDPPAAGPGESAPSLDPGPSTLDPRPSLSSAREPDRGFASPRAALLAGLGAASGYPFLEHFGRFTNPETPLFVMAGKATLGVALHLLLVPIWSQGMVSVSSESPRAAWLPGAVRAGLVHGLYNALSFLPAWTGAPLGLAYMFQSIVVGLLTLRFVRAWSGLPPPAAPGETPCESSPST